MSDCSVGASRMDRPISLEARRIDLTVEPLFQLGPARIDPRSHEITWGIELRRLQPLTMKVLVALHDKSGEVVTRDELVDRCWDGRFVGEDVVNRHISLLRRVAAESSAFEIQTVPTTGYRLIERGESLQGSDGRDLPAESPPSWRVAILKSTRARIAAGILLVSVGGVFALEHLDKPATNAVMLKPFEVAGSAPLARTFAAGVSADINSAMTATGVDVLNPDSSGKSQAQFVLSGRTEQPGADLHLTAELADAADHTVLWSTSFTRPAAQEQAMQEQVADNLAQVLHCALDTSRQAGREQLSNDSIKLYLKACALEQAVDPPSDQIQDLLKQVTQRQPDFAAGWARLAFFAANAALKASPSDVPTLRAEARMAVQRALRLDPRSGVAYNAIAELELGHVPFSTLHLQFQNVLRFDRDDAFTINDECELLMRMGSIDDSVRMCRRGVSLEPLSPVQVSDLVAALIADSRNEEAQATLDRALRIWPDDAGIKLTKLDYEARLGDPGIALSILKNADARPQNARDVTLEAYRRLAETRLARKPASTADFLRWLKQEVAVDQLDVDFAAPLLAGFGDTDGAFRMAFAYRGDPINIDPAFLWQPESLPLRRDPRFIALAAKFHVAEFWRTTGLWPDFCSTPSWPYNCRTEVARVADAKVGRHEA